MTSVQRSYDQRNNTVSSVTPVHQTTGYWDGYTVLQIDPRHSHVFTVDLSSTACQQATSSQLIANRLNAQGEILTSVTANVVYLVLVVDPAIAVAYPGLEFTIHFHTPSLNNTCVDIYPQATLTSSGGTCDLFSPVYMFGDYDSGSITLRSNGTQFKVVSSGPVSWSLAFDC
jgi:hypothetical protein